MAKDQESRLVEIDSAALQSYIARYANQHDIFESVAIEKISSESECSAKTISNWLRGKVQRGNVVSIQNVETALKLQGDETIVKRPPVPSQSAMHIRDVTGKWYFFGQDRLVPPEFDFRNEPHTTSGTMVINQIAPGQIEGQGIDKDGDVINFRGDLLGEGFFLRGTYDLINSALIVHGVFSLKFTEDGQRMVGGAIQRETGQLSTYGLIFLNLYLARKPELLPSLVAPPASVHESLRD